MKIINLQVPKEQQAKTNMRELKALVDKLNLDKHLETKLLSKLRKDQVNDLTSP